MTDLGAQMRMAAFTAKGSISQEECGKLTDAIIAKIGMTVAYPPKIYDYPHDGKGGVGYTYVQTITESFVVWDVWPEIGGAYLVICSCRPFDSMIVKTALEDAGLVVGPHPHILMELNNVAAVL